MTAPGGSGAGGPPVSQEVLSLPLPPQLRSKLLAAGFRLVADLAGVSGPQELAQGAGRWWVGGWCVCVWGGG
jgi:hypothetical protein